MEGRKEKSREREKDIETDKPTDIRQPDRQLEFLDT